MKIEAGRFFLDVTIARRKAEVNPYYGVQVGVSRFAGVWVCNYGVVVWKAEKEYVRRWIPCAHWLLRLL